MAPSRVYFGVQMAASAAITTPDAAATATVSSSTRTASYYFQNRAPPLPTNRWPAPNQTLHPQPPRPRRRRRADLVPPPPLGRLPLSARMWPCLRSRTIRRRSRSALAWGFLYPRSSLDALSPTSCVGGEDRCLEPSRARHPPAYTSLV